MATGPRRDIRNAPSREQIADVVRSTGVNPLVTESGSGSLDVFDRLQPADSDGAAASAEEAKDALRPVIETKIGEGLVREEESGTLDPSATLEDKANEAAEGIIDGDDPMSIIRQPGLGDEEEDEGSIFDRGNPGRERLDSFLEEAVSGAAADQTGNQEVGLRGLDPSIITGMGEGIRGESGQDDVSMADFDSFVPDPRADSARDYDVITGILPEAGENANAAPSVADNPGSTAADALLAAGGALAAIVPPAAAALGTAGAAMKATQAADKLSDGAVSRFFENPNQGKRQDIITDANQKRALEEAQQKFEENHGQTIEQSGQSVEPDAEHPFGLRFEDNQGNELPKTSDQLLREENFQKGRGLFQDQIAGEERPSADWAAWSRAQQAKYNYNPRASGGDIDPADNTEIVDRSGPAPVTGGDSSLVAQPNEDRVLGGSLDRLGSGMLPGDQGNIDYGEDQTGGWTSDSRTDDESTALESLYRPGLSISDAQAEGEDDDQEESSEE